MLDLVLAIRNDSGIANYSEFTHISNFEPLPFSLKVRLDWMRSNAKRREATKI